MSTNRIINVTEVAKYINENVDDNTIKDVMEVDKFDVDDLESYIVGYISSNLGWDFNVHLNL